MSPRRAHRRRTPPAAKKDSSRSGKQRQAELAAKRQSRRQAEAQQLQDHYLPDGNVIPADLSKQAKNNTYDPLTEYRDYQFTCVDCGRVEIWTARQQQWWYEVAQGTIYSRAVRCHACRKQDRKSRRDAQLPKRNS